MHSFSVTIVTKLALFIYCRRYDTPSTQALATDHINDTVSNSFALVFGALGSYAVKFYYSYLFINPFTPRRAIWPRQTPKKILLQGVKYEK